MRWGWRESNPRRPSQNMTGPRFRFNHSAKGAATCHLFLFVRIAMVYDGINIVVIGIFVDCLPKNKSITGLNRDYKS